MSQRLSALPNYPTDESDNAPVVVTLPRCLVERVVELNSQRDELASLDTAQAVSGLPICLETPAHIALQEAVVELFDDLADCIEEASFAKSR